MKTSHALAFGLVLSTCGLVHAQVPTTVVTTTTTPAAAPGTVRVSQILGSTVHLQGTNNYGKVEDIILSDDGSPAYLVVASRGRHALFPYNAGMVQVGRRVVTYDVTPQAVQPLFFEPNAYPNIADPTFTTRTSQVFPAERVRVKVRPNGTIKETIRP
jgi:hypothetical protein